MRQLCGGVALRGQGRRRSQEHLLGYGQRKPVVGAPTRRCGSGVDDSTSGSGVRTLGRLFCLPGHARDAAWPRARSAWAAGVGVGLRDWGRRLSRTRAPVDGRGLSAGSWNRRLCASEESEPGCRWSKPRVLGARLRRRLLGPTSCVCADLPFLGGAVVESGGWSGMWGLAAGRPRVFVPTSPFWVAAPSEKQRRTANRAPHM